METIVERKSDEQAAYQSLLGKIQALPQARFYCNSTPVVNVCGTDLTVWDTLTAAVISNLNTLLTGERGEGKTQLENELKDAYFGGRATYIRMRDNLRVKDLFEVYNLGKLFEGKGTVLEAKEQTGARLNPLTVIDEINRAHEKVQNQVFDIYDGYVVFEGPRGPEKLPLGVPMGDGTHFHVAVASANVGAARYAGINPIDPALLDRSHLVLNVDNYSPSAVDNAVIMTDVFTAKVSDHIGTDRTSDIIGIHKEVRGTKLALDALIALVYLKKGLDHCINPENPTHSKGPVLQSLPDMCEGCNELGRGCGYTYPVSIRSEKAIALLAKGLKVVADAKSGEVSSLRVRYQDILSAFKLVAPYSGMLDERWVAKEFLGNQQFAIDNIAQGIGTELNAMSSRLKTGYTEAIAGKLTEQTKEQFQGRWGWYGDLLVAFNTAAKGAGDLTTLDPETLAKARLQYPVLRWME